MISILRHLIRLTPILLLLLTSLYFLFLSITLLLLPLILFKHDLIFILSPRALLFSPILGHNHHLEIYLMMLLLFLRHFLHVNFKLLYQAIFVETYNMLEELALALESRRNIMMRMRLLIFR